MGSLEVYDITMDTRIPADQGNNEIIIDTLIAGEKLTVLNGPHIGSSFYLPNIPSTSVLLFYFHFTAKDTEKPRFELSCPMSQNSS
jgi:hypothetical protein